MTKYDFQKKFTPEAVDKMYQKVITLLTKEKLYKDSHFKSPQLAEALHLNRHELAFLLKTRFHCNFAQLLNHFRLEEMRYMLKDPHWQDYSIIEIAKTVGFYNRQTFFKIFCDETGLSPREFRKKFQLGWKGEPVAREDSSEEPEETEEEN